MDVFDKLPKAVRQALANADHNWSGEQLYRAYKRKHPKARNTAAMLETIAAHDVKMHRDDAARGLVMEGQR